MGFNLSETPRTYKMTRALAHRYANMEPVPHERPLSERRLAVYERLVREGKFRPCVWAEAECTEMGCIYRINGQHTSILFSKMDPLPELYVTVEKYLCKTLVDVAELYATFDSGTMSRTAGDIYMSFAGTVDSLRRLPAKIIKLSVAGMHLYEALVGTPTGPYSDVIHRSQPADRAERLLENEDFPPFLADLFAGVNDEEGNNKRQSSKHLARSPVVAAVFGTWKANVRQCVKFWEAVRDETGEQNTLPDRKLARVLLQHGVDAGGLGAKKVRTMKPREMFVKCIHAWNAWRKGETRDALKYYAEAEVPKILG